VLTGRFLDRGLQVGHLLTCLGNLSAPSVLLDTEIVGSSPERSKAVGMAAYWSEQNPEGVLGGAEDDGFLAGLFGGD